MKKKHAIFGTPIGTWVPVLTILGAVLSLAASTETPTGKQSLQPGPVAQEFLTNPIYPTLADSSAYLAVGDFNGDGKPDLVVSSDFPAYISVLLNKGDGTFLPATTYLTGSNDATPQSVQTGDFNGDGKLDIAVVDEFDGVNGITGGVTIFLGNGDGTFQTGPIYASGAQYATGLAVGDFNGDHKLDLLVTNKQVFASNYNVVGVLLGNGDGTFQPAIVTKTDELQTAAVVGDFNHDGKLDAAVTSLGGTLDILLGNGDGTFQPPIVYLQSVEFTSIAVGDLNNDGVLDLVTGGQLAAGVFIGKGDGTFQPEVQYVGSSAGQLGVALVDLNGDGNLDLVTNEMAVFYGKGDGTLQPPIFYAPGNLPTGVAAADFNGDGHIDIAVALGSLTNTFPPAAAVLINDGNGTLKAAPATSAGMNLLDPPLVGGDFNHDGKFDFATLSNYDGTIGLYFGNGDGTFQAPLITSGLKFPTSMDFGDFNGDGYTDFVVCAQQSAGVWVLLGTANGSLQKSTLYRSTFCAQPVVGDFNGDGKPDIAALLNGSSQAVYVLINNGDGTFTPGGSFAVGRGPESLVAGDFNKDGKLDLAVLNALSSNVSVLLGNGDGTFQNPVNYAVSGIGTTPTIGAADMNNDGNLDLVIHVIGVNSMNLAVDSVAVLLGNGDGTFQPPTVSLYSGGHFAISDFNGDGKLDVAGASGDLFVSLGNGDGTFQTSTRFSTGATSALAGDVNGDGAPDLIVAVTTGYSVLLNTGGTFDTLNSSPNPSNFHQPVTFSAKVSASVPGAPGGTPTGTVTFKDRMGTLGMATLSNGQASLTTSSLPVGLHSITAVYSGDSNFNPSVSSPFTQTVVGPIVGLSPSKLNFGVVKVGTTSAPQTATLTNSGSAPLKIKSVAASGDFSQTNNCPASLAVSASCTITVTFTPLQTGVLTGSVSITDNAVGSLQKILLNGTGTQ